MNVITWLLIIKDEQIVFSIKYSYLPINKYTVSIKINL